jgi:hypothetical protein
MNSGSLGWRVPYALPCDDNVSMDKIGNDAESLSARSGEMIAAPPSSSDGTGAVSFAGVEAPATGAAPGAAPGAGEAALAAAEGRRQPQRRNHPWVFRVK